MIAMRSPLTMKTGGSVRLVRVAEVGHPGSVAEDKDVAGMAE